MKLTKAKKSIKKVTRNITKVAAKVSKPVLKSVKQALKKEQNVSSRSVSGISKKIKTVLLTQAKPENDKNPYIELSRKYQLEIEFKPFVHLEQVTASVFRKFKVNPLNFDSVVITSRNIADHFFKLCEDMRIRMPDETKYYCMTESVALYLQKYIQYRKRRVFYGEGSLDSFFKEVLHYYKEGDKFFIPCADVHKSDIADFLRKHNIHHAEGVILNTVPIELKKKDLQHDALIFFSPGGVNALLKNFPDYKQKGQVIGGFGPLTVAAIEDENWKCDIIAPTPESPSMAMALEKYILASRGK
ncbi:MAG TPA: uroporphyrinogen-III synthase [Bacteroidetes bacterium]|nr:uroporphyrinogen-III synthase [Bacteroidota bacterium]